MQLLPSGFAFDIRKSRNTAKFHAPATAAGAAGELSSIDKKANYFKI
jgi:hypothetical protein